MKSHKKIPMTSHKKSPLNPIKKSPWNPIKRSPWNPIQNPHEIPMKSHKKSPWNPIQNHRSSTKSPYFPHTPPRRSTSPSPKSSTAPWSFFGVGLEMDEFTELTIISIINYQSMMTHIFVAPRSFQRHAATCGGWCEGRWGTMALLMALLVILLRLGTVPDSNRL